MKNRKSDIVTVLLFCGFLGTMLLGLPENEAEANKALAYIQSQKAITVEEVK